MINLKNSRRKIAIVTGTRADWGLLSPVARALAARGDCDVQIVATNMHLDRRRGYTIDEIRADGFDIAATVAMNTGGETAAECVFAMGECMRGMAVALQHLQPDIAVILGDRYEMLAAASAAAVMRIPIVHIAGGEVSEGAFDDNIRHAITKLSALHLTATEPYRQRVIQMGEHPDRVINTGALGVHNILATRLMSERELEDSLGFKLLPGTLLVTFHPATMDTVSADIRFGQLLTALARTGAPVLFTYPNNDPEGQRLIDMIENFVAGHPGQTHAVPSLGRTRYLSALQFVAAVVGNSSSGIVEVPSMHIPTVDIGIRQRGRIAAGSVIHCGDSANDIAAAIDRAISPQAREAARVTVNPYYRPDTLRLVTEAIAGTPLHTLSHKQFHDL